YKSRRSRAHSHRSRVGAHAVARDAAGGVGGAEARGMTRGGSSQISSRAAGAIIPAALRSLAHRTNAEAEEIFVRYFLPSVGAPADTPRRDAARCPRCLSCIASGGWASARLRAWRVLCRRTQSVISIDVRSLPCWR